MIDTWNPAKLNEKISGRDSWNPAILNEAVTNRDSWNPAILNESSGETPVVFEATITASFPEGATCTATDGTTTLTADANPMAFSIPNEGTWAVACVANGVTFSEDVVITTNGQTETVDLTPVGDTYATTDSVPVLIACAGIGDSEITTIAGALADVETLTAILESENAVDYLVRSTIFASDVTADSVAMTGIGSINYDANTLLSDGTWLAAICNSTYFESVLNVKVPVMTSNTTPSGTCFGKEGEDYYKAFDNNLSTFYSGSYSSYNVQDWVGYTFSQAVKVYYSVLHSRDNVEGIYKIQASNDMENWTDIEPSTSIPITGKNIIITSPGTYTSYRVYGNNATNTSDLNTKFREAQFYGRVDVD